MFQLLSQRLKRRIKGRKVKNLYLKILRADLGHLPLVKAIRLKSLETEREAFASIYEEALNYDDSFWENWISNNIILLALVGRKAVGIIRAALEDEDVEKGTAFIASFYVNRNYRGKGVGMKLMNKLLRELKKYDTINAARLWVGEAQKPAIELYKKLGFEKVGEEERKDSDKKVVEVIFERNF